MIVCRISINRHALFAMLKTRNTMSSLHWSHLESYAWNVNELLLLASSSKRGCVYARMEFWEFSVRIRTQELGDDDRISINRHALFAMLKTRNTMSSLHWSHLESYALNANEFANHLRYAKGQSICCSFYSLMFCSSISMNLQNNHSNVCSQIPTLLLAVQTHILGFPIPWMRSVNLVLKPLHQWLRSLQRRRDGCGN
jgi:hypothetical protein